MIERYLTLREWNEVHPDYVVLDPDGWQEEGISTDASISKKCFEWLALKSTMRQKVPKPPHVNRKLWERLPETPGNTSTGRQWSDEWKEARGYADEYRTVGEWQRQTGQKVIPILRERARVSSETSVSRAFFNELCLDTWTLRSSRILASVCG